MESYDAVVIGAGNGGLTASAALAGKGLRVLLLERHNIPGGCATSFRRGRFEFEVALHQLSGLGTSGAPGPLRQTLGGLGVLDDLDFIQMNELYNAVLPDGSQILLTCDKNECAAVLSDRFPHQREAIGKFFDLAYRFTNEFLSVFVFKDPAASREKYPVLYEYAYKTSAEVLDGLFSDHLLKSVLSVYWGYLGLPPTRLSFAYLALLFFTYIEFKPFHIKGGSQALSNALYSRFVRNKGEARFNCGASRIKVKDGAAVGVVLDDGEEVRANYVVSNISPIAVYNQLMSPDQVPPQVAVEMRGRSLSASAFTLYIGFDREPGELGLNQPTNFLMDSLDLGDGILNRMRRIDVSDELLVLSCYDAADPTFSAPGTCQANVVTLKYGEPWLRVPPSQYYQVKYRVAEAMLRRVERAWPGARAHIEEIEAATPLTHMRYLGHPNGAVYGFEHYTKDSFFFQPGRFSPIKGLFFASGWSGDAGFQPTLEAGQTAANSIIRELGIK
ncbi:MAG: NAD(P)/FAD-dependent oxidoreductase [Pseudomonadota bacterium]